ncbi:MAG: hypothetical protein AAF804_07995 [Bacteroidota bacterium]
MRPYYWLLIFLGGILPRLHAQTTITFNVSDIETTMDNRGAGFCNSFITDRPELTPNLIKTGATTLRFPMGTLAENYLFHNFDQNYADLAGGSVVLRPRVCSVDEAFSGYGDINATTLEFNPDLLDFDEFMVMCDSVGAEPVIMLSVIGDLLDGSLITKAQLMRNAIEWVTYAKDKYDITYWELGNEVAFHNGNSPISPQEYVDRYLYLQDTLKKIDPSIKLGMGSLGFGNEVTIPTLLSFPDFIDKMDFFILHQYNAAGIDTYEEWRNLTTDITNTSVNSNQDLIKNLKISMDLFDQQIPTHPNLANLEYLITEYSTQRQGWAEDGQHITQSLLGFQQAFNLFLYDQRVKYTHFWVTTSPWGNRNTFDGSAEAFNPLNEWEITPQGMTVLLFNKFVQHNLIQPVANGTVGCYASSSADGQKLTLFILNKDSVATDVTVNLLNYAGATNNVKWVYSGAGNPYDKRPLLRQIGSAEVNGGVVSTTLAPISLTVVELGVSAGTGSIPSVPGSLETTPGTGLGAAVEVSFDAAAGADFYELQRKIGSGDFETLIFLDSLTRSYTETPVDVSQIYTYRVRAGNVHGYSAFSSSSMIQPEVIPGTGIRLFNTPRERIGARWLS